MVPPVLFQVRFEINSRHDHRPSGSAGGHQEDQPRDVHEAAGTKDRLKVEKVDETKALIKQIASIFRILHQQKLRHCPAFILI